MGTARPSHLQTRLSTLPPTQLIALTSSTTALVLLFLQHGPSGLSSHFQSLRQWIRWSHRRGLSSTLRYYGLQIAKSLPWTKRRIRRDIDEKRDALVRDVEAEWNDLLDDDAKTEAHSPLVLPQRTSDPREILTLLTKWSNKEREIWQSGRASGAIYHGNGEFHEFLGRAYGLFSVANPLHPDLFPYVRKMEGEVVAMMIRLFRGRTDRDAASSSSDNDNDSATPRSDQVCCGTLTSGGTESILLTCKAHRDRARDLFGIASPEIIAPSTIHAAFQKAAHYFGMRLILVDVDERTGRVDVDDVRKHMTRNTVLVAGSAPNFPHGIIDPIRELSELARERGVGFHSDCCLGGMILPFVEKLQSHGRLDDILSRTSENEDDIIPPYDFRLPGVTSLSADMHKYGYAPKGSSCILYSSEELRRYQYFVSIDWTGGIYASPTLAGSRPGGIAAATWAAMVHLGEEGYLDLSEGIIRTARAIRDGIRNEIEGLEVMGNPLSSVVAFRSTEKEVNIYGVGQAMAKKGWNLNSLQYPSCLHICCTNLHREKEETFLKDLRTAVEEVRVHPEKYAGGSAAVYGMAHSIPDATLLEPIARGFIDALFSG